MKVGWKDEKLGDLCRIVGGGTPSKLNGAFYGGEIPWATVRDMKDAAIENTEFKISQEAVDSSSTNVIPKNNVVIATRVGLGKVCLLKNDTAINQDLRGIIPKGNNLNVRFLFWWFKSIADIIEKEGTGATVKGVKLPFIKGLNLPCPSLTEQCRIVTLLDEAFSNISKAKENTEKNLKNSRDLFESYLQSIFQDPKWEEKTLGEIATFRNGMNFTKGSKGEVIKIVGVRDFQKSFWVPFDNLESVTIDGKLSAIDFLKEDDILAVRSNGNPELIGRTLLAGNVIGKVSHSGFTIRIRLNSKNVYPAYLCRYLKSQKARKELVASGTGVNIKSLNQQALSSLPLPLPPLSEQKSITQKLDALSEQTKKLEKIYQQKLDLLEELKKSVLKKAFAGEL